jgi:1-pyrroline-5-carboxylate dehydrogenase
MLTAISQVPTPRNEPILSYAPGTPERTQVKQRLREMSAERIEIPLFIGGKEVRTGKTAECRMPHDHAHVIATYHRASKTEVGRAIDAAAEARAAWAATPWETRAAIFLKAADLLTGRHRATANVATMLGQSKTIHQAEIDAVCELADFWRFNVHYASRLYAEQPMSPASQWNQLDYRPLDGFVFAVTPFNFTSISGNLPTAPAIMGNTVVWKPASTAIYSAHYTLQVLREAGLPDGVINMVLGSGGEIGDPILGHPDLGGIHFTGSTSTFHGMWATVATNMKHYRQYPRLVGETGGKDFVFAHASADVGALVPALVRGAFEYQGQKCSAASRAYIPDNLWPKVRERLVAEVEALRVGDVANFRNFMGAVIDKASFANIASYLALAKAGPSTRILCGGSAEEKSGWFVHPTVVVSDDPKHRLMSEEIFGPVLTIYVYAASKFEETLRLCDTTAPYALTGAVFAQDRYAVEIASRSLRFAAGNFYVNDKPTGAVVGQQPFGGSRASGTNDKAGSLWNLMRWVSPRAIKENFDPPRAVDYPFMAEE